jgi:hypothetical protein
MANGTYNVIISVQNVAPLMLREQQKIRMVDSRLLGDYFYLRVMKTGG